MAGGREWRGKKKSQKGGQGGKEGEGECGSAFQGGASQRVAEVAHVWDGGGAQALTRSGRRGRRTGAAGSRWVGGVEMCEEGETSRRFEGQGPKREGDLRAKVQNVKEI